MHIAKGEGSKAGKLKTDKIKIPFFSPTAEELCFACFSLSFLSMWCE
jgi:hypothetical protein